MGKLIAFEWMSLDGVFDADSMSEWWEPYDSPDRQKIIQATYAHTGAFLMGQTTYDLLAPHWSRMQDDEMGGVAGSLSNTPKYVASETPLKTPWKNTTVLDGDVDNAVRKLKQKFDEIVLIGSATLAESLIQASLFDEYKFIVQPVIMGDGQRFFKNHMRTNLQLVEVQKLVHGVLLLHYGSASK